MALVGAFSVIVQLRRLIVCSTTGDTQPCIYLGPINEELGSWCWCFAELVNLSTFNFRTSIEPLSTMISVLFNIFSYLSFDLGGNFVN